MTWNWEVGKDIVGKTYDEIKSKRRYGVELEVGKCEKGRELQGTTCWGAKKDDSHGVDTEFYSPILQGDEGLASIRKFTNCGRKFQMNLGCGYHLHIDCTNLNDIELKRVAVAYVITRKCWMLFCPATREDNKYCKPDNKTVQDFESEKKFTEIIPKDGDRRYWANWASYHKHHTLEIRFHQGTTNEDKIINWVKGHLWLVDWAKSQDIAAIKDKFGFQVKEKGVKIANNELECTCHQCQNTSGFSIKKEIEEIMPSPEKIMVGLSQIWNEKDPHITEYYLSRIKKHLGDNRQFNFAVVKEELGANKVLELV